MEIRPRKRFAQYWLRSPQVLERIVACAQLVPTDRVLEIGPGMGALTRPLLDQGCPVVAVEIDSELCRHLVQRLGERENFLLLQGDFLKLDLASLLVPFPRWQQPNKVVANIPYHITAPILEVLLGRVSRPRPDPFESVTLLVQQEVAERLRACPGSKAYGALSVKIQYLATVEVVLKVPAAAFHPVPQVDSAVITLHPRPLTPPAQDCRWLEQLIQTGFARRRKMLRNNLKGLVDPAELEAYFHSCRINSQCRAEELSLREWVDLSNALTPRGEIGAPLDGCRLGSPTDH